MLELFSGSGTVAAVFRAAGWETVTVDADAVCAADVVARVEDLEWAGPPFDFVWASPPCTTFSLAHYMRGARPSGADWPLVQLTRRQILRLRPQYWVIENVRGLVSWWPDYRLSVGPFFLWGHFPLFGVRGPAWKGLYSAKRHRRINRLRARAGLVAEGHGPRDPRKRAMIPRELAEALCLAITQQPHLPF